MEREMERTIARRGMLGVNFPIVIIIFSSWVILLSLDIVSLQNATLIAGAIGWIYWEFAVVKWIRWSLLQGVDKTKLYKIGKRNLLVWSEFKIDDVAKKIEKE